MPPLFVTFYSYKGGVGRTQALANVGVALANRGHKVILVDMDLESPGLHNFFRPVDDPARPLGDADFAKSPGLLDFLETCRTPPEAEPRVEKCLVRCSHPFLRDGEVWLLPPGRLDDDYAQRVTAFPWHRFYEEEGGFGHLEMIRRQLLSTGAGFVLLDSRTGMSDVGTVCTFQLPDVLVVLFAMHRQGIDGAWRVAEAVKRRREEEGPEVRPRRVLLIPSRVDETGELALLEEYVALSRVRLVESGELWADLHRRIPYLARFAYGEQVVVDPDGEPNSLSETYVRLAERLIREAGAGEADQRPTSSSPAELRTGLKNLEEGIAALVKRAEHCSAATLTLAELARRGHELGDSRVRVREEVRSLLERGNDLADRAGKSRTSLAAFLPESDRLEDWRGLSSTLRKWVEAVGEAWLGVHSAQLRIRLSQQAPDDATAVEEAMRALGPLLESGRLEEVEARLPALEEELRRSSLLGLLRRGELDDARLARSLPDSAARDGWLADRLQQALEAGPRAEAQVPILTNLLRLRLGRLKRPTGSEWSAYEVLSAHAEGDPGSRLRLFRELGARLWAMDWRAILDASEPSVDVDAPSGPRLREELIEVHESSPESVGGIVEAVVRGLDSAIRSFGEDVARSLLLLFRRRREDPCLREAVLQVGRDCPELDVRRRLLGLWLMECDSYSREHRTIGELLRVLVRSDLEVEAFHALCALGKTDRSLAEGSSLDFVYVAFLLKLIEWGRLSDVAELVADPQLRERLSGSAAGLALLVAVGGGYTRLADEEVAMTARADLLHRFAHGSRLPVRTVEWLARLERKEGVVDQSWARQLRKLVDDLREQGGGQSFPGSAETSRQYQTVFDAHATAILEGLLDDIRPRVVVDAELGGDSGDQWIREALKLQRGKGALGFPQGERLADMRQKIVRFVDLLRRVNSLRPVDGAPSLREILATAEARERGRTDLLDWIRERTREVKGLDQILLRRVEEQFVEAS